jgi:hypothetical protein
MHGNVQVRFGGRGRRNGVREIEPPRSAPTLLKQLPKRSGEYLFEIILRRYETKSTMMTSNRPLEDWGKLLGDVPATTAILDRFLHHAEIITITGRSYRLKNKAAKETNTSKESKTDDPAPEAKS